MTRPKHLHRGRGSKLTQKERLAQGVGQSTLARQHIPITLPVAPWEDDEPSTAKEKKHEQ